MDHENFVIWTECTQWILPVWTYVCFLFVKCRHLRLSHFLNSTTKINRFGKRLFMGMSSIDDCHQFTCLLWTQFGILPYILIRNFKDNELMKEILFSHRNSRVIIFTDPNYWKKSAKYFQYAVKWNTNETKFGTPDTLIFIHFHRRNRLKTNW